MTVDQYCILSIIKCITNYSEVFNRNFMPRTTWPYASIDPPGHGRIGGHYFHTWCPYVRPKNKKALQFRVPCVLINGHLLAVAWRVIFNSLDLFILRPNFHANKQFCPSVSLVFMLQKMLQNYYKKRQESSMTHSARPIVTPVANIVFCCFVFLHLKYGDVRTDNMCEDNIPTSREFGLAEWIKKREKKERT